ALFSTLLFLLLLLLLSPFTLHHSPFAIRHSPFAVRPVLFCSGCLFLTALPLPPNSEVHSSRPPRPPRGSSTIATGFGPILGVGINWTLWRPLTPPPPTPFPPPSVRTTHRISLSSLPRFLFCPFCLAFSGSLVADCFRQDGSTLACTPTPGGVR
ncbi:unnamed protein product, partial [Protopolystoma xenopodis]